MGARRWRDRTEDLASGPVLEVQDLQVSYRSRGRTLKAVQGVSLMVRPGQTVAVVGESGSGKSTVAHAIMGLLPATGRVDGGRLLLQGRDITDLGGRGRRSIRGREIGLIPQDPMVALDPVQRVGRQVAEVLKIHGLARSRLADVKAIDLLARAGIVDPLARARAYPHELSGGMRQRVLIAIALAADPGVLIADEPTSALDVTVQRRILDHLEELRRESGLGMLFITHDLGVAADRAQYVVVMSRGKVVEQGPADEVLYSPQHPYTQQLLAAAPSLSAVLPIRPRLESRDPMEQVPIPPVLVATGLTKDFAVRGQGAKRTILRAVDTVTLTVQPGETVGLVGESGSGKSTLARLILRLEQPTSGTISLLGQDITHVRGDALRAVRRQMQLVYQNPYSSLNPKFTIAEAVEEPLRSFRTGDRAARLRRVETLIEQVALPRSVLRRRPSELSGGQRQRVAIARALALEPALLVCDEPVSALDVSVQSQILTLLSDLQAELKISYLFISHDLAIVREISDYVIVMQKGQLVERASAEEIFGRPSHPYTKELLAAIPGFDRISTPWASENAAVPSGPTDRSTLERDVPLKVTD